MIVLQLIDNQQIQVCTNKQIILIIIPLRIVNNNQLLVYTIIVMTTQYM